ncbi:hypothetical protein SLS56_008239 [Neofusicoccum ribis]|uniref:Uncharacterized protein n=1 Tax=Neofusicoccum ribis TaxID=45134 RepID=A0ABR3SKP7_9PEZI
MSKVWLITGCSSGFGQEIARAAAQSGDTVVATARDVSKLDGLTEPGIVKKRLDVLADDAEMRAVVDDVVGTVGRIDVLVNNAGYVLEPGGRDRRVQVRMDSPSRAQVDRQFATNIYGQLNVLRAVAPHMRARRSGVIANLGSIGGWAGGAAAGIYCATKAAVAVYSEALRAELAPLGVDVTCVEPGYFRTNLLTGGRKTTAARRVPELAEATRATREALESVSLRQPGDPAKGARVIVDALTKRGRCEGRTLPARLALGSDAVKMIGDVLERNRRDLEEWADIVSKTDCDDVGTS